MASILICTVEEMQESVFIDQNIKCCMVIKV